MRDKALGREANPMVYIPIGQLPDALTSLISQDLRLVWAVRTTTDPSAFSTAIQRELRTASGGLPVGEVRAMTQVMANSTAREHFNTMLLSVFAGLAVKSRTASKPGRTRLVPLYPSS